MGCQFIMSRRMTENYIFQFYASSTREKYFLGRRQEPKSGFYSSGWHLSQPSASPLAGKEAIPLSRILILLSCPPPENIFPGEDSKN